MSKSCLKNIKTKKNYNFIPFIIIFISFAIIYGSLIYNIFKGENNEMTEVWQIIAYVVTPILVSIIGLFTYIFIANRKNSKKEDLEDLNKKSKSILSQIGEDKNTSLIRDHKEIIKKIEKNLENNDSFILSKLNNIDKFVSKEELKKELLGSERDYLKIIELSRTKDKLDIERLEKSIKELLVKNNELKEKNKELLNKINNLDPDNDRSK